MLASKCVVCKCWYLGVSCAREGVYVYGCQPSDVSCTEEGVCVHECWDLDVLCAVEGVKLSCSD